MLEPREGLFFVALGGHMFDGRTSCLVVVGAQWGDEGKGKLVDVLAERADLVVRYQGGANAGHTVVIGDTQFILRQIPSGILHPGVTCVVGNGVVLEPETFFGELDQLAERGISTAGRIVVSDRAHLVLPYHKLLDAASEKSQKLGTTGRGIGPAYEDKYGRRGIRVTDLRRLECARALLTDRVQRANRLLQMMGSPERASFDQHAELLERLAPRILPLAADAGLLVHRAVREGKRVLLEGAQGSLLDVDHGTYPFVTSSNTTAGGAAVGAGIGPTLIHGVLGVVKAYTTRVGNGPLPTEAPSPHGDRLRQLGGEFGAVTGRPRRCGWFDATVVRYAARVNGLTGLAVTKLDVLDGFEDIPVCTAYRLDGDACEEMPAEVEALGRVEPEYETLRGWNRPTGGARNLSDLPPEARAYLDRLEQLSGVPVRYVSVGTRRDQIIETGNAKSVKSEA
jgi:adenylosuccinate synthase